MKNEVTVRGESTRRMTPLRHAARFLVFVLTQALILQPAAFAATWNVAQQPLFTINAVQPNAVFMLDDSWSMNDYRLPPPSFLLQGTRWPATPTVTIKYGIGTRTVATHDEFTLRSNEHNPLAYNPAITYLPWNDNDKPSAAQGARPTRAQSYPPADIGGTGAVATAGRFTERDMRFRGFADATPSSARNWITSARGTVGGSNTFYAPSPAGDRWAWHVANKRWEQPIAGPAGTAIYNPLPGDGPQAADLFTNPPAICTASPPCIEWNTKEENQCKSWKDELDGYTKKCVSQIDEDVFGNVCVAWDVVPDGYKNGACVQTEKQLKGHVNGACIKTESKPKTKTVCKMETVVDPTSETGYREIQVCTDEPDGFEDVCVDWEKVPVYQDVCIKYDQVEIFKKVCKTTEWQKTGTKKVCNGWTDEPVYKKVCETWELTTVNTTCKTTDPGWTCPPANITSDNLTPARYYVYEGPVPATDDDLATVGHYRMVEIDRASPAGFAVPVDPRTGNVRKRVDCKTNADPFQLDAGSDLCTRTEEMQNYANWFTYYRHRLFAAMAVTSHAAADLKGDLSALRLGYGRINYSDNGPDPWNPYGPRLNGATFPELDNDPATPPHPGAIVRGVRDFSDTPGNVARQQFFDWIFSLNWVGSTPNREALDSMGKYYMRTSDFGPWSDNPGVGGGRSGNDHASCRRSFAILASDGEWTAIPEVPPVPPAQPLITSRPADPVGAGGGTVTASLATTGPTIPGHGMYALENYTYSPGAEPQFSTGHNGVTQTLTDVALYWWNRDLRPMVPNSVQKRPSRPNDSFWQSMTTFVVGYGLNASMDTEATRQSVTDGLAVNWPQVDTASNLISGGERINDTMRAALATRGDFYSASDPDQMRRSIRGVFRAIAEQAFSGTGLGSTSAQLTVGTTLYRASFRTQAWTGQLEAFDAFDMAMAAKNATPTPAALWEASFPDWDARKLYTSTSASTAVAFNDFATLSGAQQADLGSANVMDYIRGKQIGLEAGKGDPLNHNTTLGFRARSTLLGSIVSSTPLYSKAPDFGYRLNPAAGGGSTYNAYVNSNKASRKAAVYVGANAGVFHAFDANRNPLAGGGKELFGYVPRSGYANLSALTQVDYVHRFFVDGPVVEGDVHIGGSWKTVVMGSSGAGAPGIFALDVTNPETFDQTKVLWDITPAEEPDLGRVMGHGYIGSVKYNAGGKWVAIVPNGYASANNRAVLLIIDVATGALVRKIDTCKKNDGSNFGSLDQDGRCDPALLNGLANASVIYDANRNVTGVLSGDYQGNLWRFDLSDKDPAKWKIHTEDEGDASGNTPAPAFTAKNAANERQPITSVPRAATHPFGGIYVVFGTGKFFEYQDQTNVEMQSVYGIWLKPNDKHPVKLTDLQKFGLAQSAVPPITRTLTGTAGFSWRTKSGWYFNLMKDGGTPLGERIIADPVIDRGLLSMTSFQPTSASNPCEGGGSSFFYSIPMDASFFDLTAQQVNGVVSSITRLTIESPVSGTRATDLNKPEASAAMQSGDITRNMDGSTSVSNRVLECVKIYNQVNVQTGYLPGMCGFTAPIRVWRPIR